MGSSLPAHLRSLRDIFCLTLQVYEGPQRGLDHMQYLVDTGLDDRLHSAEALREEIGRAGYPCDLTVRHGREAMRYIKEQFQAGLLVICEIRPHGPATNRRWAALTQDNPGKVTLLEAVQPGDDITPVVADFGKQMTGQILVVRYPLPAFAVIMAKDVQRTSESVFSEN